jgi:CHAT domain-containing protein
VKLGCIPGLTSGHIARVRCVRQGSDGLRTFKETFDLHLDADLVLLSACDTAGEASGAATQQAGLGTGGDVALVAS